MHILDAISQVANEKESGVRVSKIAYWLCFIVHSGLQIQDSSNL